MNLHSIDLNLLLAFEALVEERSVTRAARRVGLSQPAMSNALARLRRTFDDPLLVRVPDGMAPTPFAQSLAGPVRAALGHLREAIEERPAFDPAASNRTFELLANDYVESEVVPRLLRAIGGRGGEIGVRVRRPESLFQAPSASVLSEACDLAIGFFPDTLSLDASVRSRQLWEEANVCIASGEHPSIRGRLSLRQYAAARHVAIFYKSQGPGVIDTILAQKGLTRRLAARTPHFAVVAEIVAASDLIATVPERFARRETERLGLQVLPVPVAVPPFRVSMLWHERLDADPAHVWLRDLVASVVTTR